MELHEFVALVPKFAALSHPERVLHFGWYLHTHGKRDRFDSFAILQCYDAQNMERPRINRELDRLVERKPRVLLVDGKGYFLEHRIRAEFDKKYGEHETTIAVSQLLKELPGRISDEAERLFLSEALKCYKASAFRAATVMTWNLAYDHLLNWLLQDAQRMSDFHSKIVGRIGSKRGTGMVITKREDFEDLKEGEVLDICGTAGVLPSDNIKKILDMQLTKRNLAAHPSLIDVDRPTGDDTIHALVTNVILKLR